MDDNQQESYLDTEDQVDQVEQSEEFQNQIDEQPFEQQFAGVEAPQAKKPDSLYSLFQKVWSAQDSSKVANLDKFELGKLDINVRDSQYLDLLSKMLKHEKFGQFWKAQGEITLATSASKKGWFTELFVSQKKFTTRASQMGQQPPQSSGKRKWSIFGGTNQNQNQTTTQDS